MLTHPFRRKREKDGATVAVPTAIVELEQRKISVSSRF
jgi:hypothetical protein